MKNTNSLSDINLCIKDNKDKRNIMLTIALENDEKIRIVNYANRNKIDISHILIMQLDKVENIDKLKITKLNKVVNKTGINIRVTRDEKRQIVRICRRNKITLRQLILYCFELVSNKSFISSVYNYLFSSFHL